MAPSVVTASIAAVAAIIAALWSAKNSRDIEALRHDYGRDIEQLRHGWDEAKRLGGATGALRLQLFLSTRSIVRRLRQYYYRPHHTYPLGTDRETTTEPEYHAAGLMIFRLIRPLTLSHLIEKQTFFGDLLIDHDMVDVQRFSHAAFEMLSGDALAKMCTGSDLHFDEMFCWDPEDTDGPSNSRRLVRPFQRVRAGYLRSGTSSEPVRPFQRVRASYLRSAAAALVVSEPGREPVRRCMAHDEFLHAWEHPHEAIEFHASLRPVKAVIDQFHPATNPVFWLRFVGYTYVCKWFHDQVRDKSRSRADIHYNEEKLPVVDMLAVAHSQYVGSPDKILSEIIDGSL